LAAAPILADLTGYRRSHLRHHRLFGTREDPDRVRHVDLLLDNLDRTSLGAFVIGMMLRMPAYWVSWYTSGGLNLRTVLRLFGWLISIGLIVQLASGSTALVMFTTGSWLISLMFVLPIIRFVGEAAEHLYTEGDTVFDTTISNIGWVHRLLIHPHGDGFHTVHHLWPTIPHFAVGHIHRLLVATDPQGYGMTVRVRTRVLQTPVRGSEQVSDE
jgi:fatty acid desaturase